MKSSLKMQERYRARGGGEVDLPPRGGGSGSRRRGLGTGEESLHFHEELADIKWFFEKLVSAESSASDRISEIGVTGKDDNLHRWVMFFHMAEHLKPIDLRHLQIKDDEGERDLLHNIQRLLTVIGCLDVVAARRQFLFQHFGDKDLVIDDENFLSVCHFTSPFSGGMGFSFA